MFKGFSLKSYFPFYKRNFKVALPIMFAQAGQMSVQLIDSIMIGHVGTAQLAASSFSTSLFTMGYVFGMGFAYGVTPLVGQAYGKGDKVKIGELFGDSTQLNLSVTALLFLIMYSISYLMPYMGQPESVVVYAVPYYRTLVWSMIPLLLFYNIKQFLEGLGNTQKATFSTIVANISNIILNYILIYGKLGFQPMGLTGAGVSTLISRVLMLLILWYLFTKSEYYVKYKDVIFLLKFRLSSIYRLFKFSIPIAFQFVIEVVAFAFGSIMMGWFGEIELAAHQIAMGLVSFTYMVATGIGAAATIRISYQKGAKQFRELRTAGIASFHLVLMFMSLTALGFFIFKGLLPQLFTNDVQVIQIASVLLIYGAIFQIVDGMQLVGISALRGLGDVKFSLWVSVLSYGLVSLGGSYLCAFVFNLGYGGIWIGYVLGLSFASVIFVRRFNRLSKQLKINNQNSM